MLWLRHEINQDGTWDLIGLIKLLSFFSDPDEISHRNIAIGRCSSVDIQVDNIGVSRWHAFITIFRNKDTSLRLVLEDNRSENGTWINGQKIIEPADLKIGDSIDFFGRQRIVLIESPYELREKWGERKPGETHKKTFLVGRNGT